MTKGDYKNAKGVLPWKKGDELSEHIINRFRDGGEDAKPYYYRKWVNAEALADKRLALLKRYDKGLQREPVCFSCGIMSFNEDTEMWEHTDDCELAEAVDE